MRKYLVVYEKTRTGFSAYAPDLPGVVTIGRSQEIVEKNIYAAILFHLEGLKEEKMRIPNAKAKGEVLVFTKQA